MSTQPSPGLELLRTIRARMNGNCTAETDRSLAQDNLPAPLSGELTALPTADGNLVPAFDGTEGAKGPAKTDKSQNEELGAEKGLRAVRSAAGEDGTAKTDETPFRRLLSVLAVPTQASPPESRAEGGARNVEATRRYWCKVKAIQEIRALPARFEEQLKAAGFPRAAILTVSDSHVLAADVREAMVNNQMLVLGEVSEDDIAGSLESAIRSLRPALPTVSTPPGAGRANPHEAQCVTCGTRMSIVRVGDICGYCLMGRSRS